MSLKSLLEKSPEDLLLGNSDVQKNALNELKSALDSVASKYSHLGGITVEGLKAEQAWVQSQMVLESVLDKMGDQLAQLNGLSGGKEASSDSNSASDSEVDSEASELEQASNSDLEVGDMIDDYEEEEISEEEKNANESELLNNSNEEEEEEEEEGSDNSDQSNFETNKEDNFDLAEFQQHVLNLDKLEEEDPQSGEEDDEEIDYFNELNDSSDDADMKYEDFFGKPRKQKKPAASSASESLGNTGIEDEDEYTQIMSQTRKDLFESDEEEGEGQEMSKFEQQQAEIAAQIAELEDENVGTKEWGMRGEVKAKERPEESLVNADIDFERNAKPAPVITDEVTIDLENLIKERIRKNLFDDIPKRNENLDIHTKRELPELSQNKSQKSLAELYEEDHQRQENPDYYAQLDSQTLSEAHKEAINLFKQVTTQLDSLCNWQYTPRAPQQSLSIQTSDATIRMEDQQPSTMAQGSTKTNAEVYKSERGAPMADTEMSTSLKRRKRKAKKNAANQKPMGKKEEMFNTLQKGKNVTVLDSKGQKHSLQGEKPQTQSASYIKL